MSVMSLWCSAFCCRCSVELDFAEQRACNLAVLGSSAPNASASEHMGRSFVLRDGLESVASMGL